MDDFDFLDDEILDDDIEDLDCVLDDDFIDKHFHRVPISVIENFPFIEDDVDALTDYELFTKGFGYLDEKKADKSEIPIVPTKVSELENDSGYITKDVNDLTNYTKTSDLATVALTGDYDDLLDKPTIPTVPTDISAFNNDAGYITKDVNDLTNYTLTSSLSTVATSGDYDDLLNKPTIPTVPTNVSAFNNDSGYITNTVDDLTNYTTSNSLTTLLSGKENVIESGSNTNGYYMKFDNGYMIQWNKTTVQDQAINTQYGSTVLYYGQRTITFPVSFYDANPSVSCSMFKWGTGGSWGAVNNVSATTATLMGYDLISRSSGTNCLISWIAIGKWK